VDSFFTPTKLATALIAKATLKAPAVIADFAAGDGELLRSASARWPNAHILATDIDRNCIVKLRQQNGWNAYEHDFLGEPEGNGTYLPFQTATKCNLVIMNPPFSCRGSKVWTTNLGDFTVKTSIAMAFLLRAIFSLAPKGQILTILPAGCINSQKDYLAWKLVRALCKCDILGANGHRTFPLCSPRTVSLRLSLRDKPLSMSFESPRENGLKDLPARNLIVLSRGNVDMVSLSKRKVRSGIPLVHTTEMKEHRAQLWRKIQASQGTRLFRGPMILLPRVGNPRKDKIILYESCRRIAVSSCVLTISCKGNAVARLIYKLLITNWRSVEKQYTGTCARYMTLEGLRELLADFGYNAELSPCVLSQSRKMQRHENLMLPPLEFLQLFQNGKCNAIHPKC
jgi:hypothetical protein